VYASGGEFSSEGGQRFMAQDSFKRFRYAAASINLFGLMLSVATWAFKVFAPHTHGVQPLAQFIRTLGVFFWILGLLLFIAAWIAEGFAGDGVGAE
jgi:hypothetical protein